MTIHGEKIAKAKKGGWKNVWPHIKGKSEVLAESWLGKGLPFKRIQKV